MSRMKRLPKAIKRGTTSLFVFGIALFPAVSALNLFDGMHSTAQSDNRPVTALPAFARRPQDMNGPLRPFEEPIITVTFDDGWESIYNDAVPLLQKYGIRSTQYVLSGTLHEPEYMSAEQIAQIHNAGQEIGCHSATHADLPRLDDTQLRAELVDCQTFYENLLGIPITQFASPYSSINNRSLTAIKSVYQSQRNTYADINNGLAEIDVNTRTNLDVYNINSFAIREDTTLEDIKHAVEYTITTKSWLVLTYHQPEDDAPFGLSTKGMEEHFSYLSSQPVRIASIGDVINTIYGNQMEY